MERFTRAGAVNEVGTRSFTARAVTYGVVDDYNTIFDAGCAKESMVGGRMPVLCWSHDWSKPLGKATRVVRDDAKALDIEFRFDDLTKVAYAEQAYTQLKSGTITEVSIGFATRSAYEDANGIKHFRQIEIDEVSLVVRGAVPGAQVLAVRSRARDDYRSRLTQRYLDGRITKKELDAALELDTEAEVILSRFAPGRRRPTTAEDEMLARADVLVEMWARSGHLR